jgi:hypothetical protein
MGSVVLFTDSAFRHGYEEEDFYEVLESRPFKTRSKRGLKNVYEVLGRNHAGEYLHIALRQEAGVTTVFHMMRMNQRQKRLYRSHR